MRVRFNRSKMFLLEDAGMRPAPSRLGAGLIEAVAAVAIVALGMITLVGMFAPFTKVQNISQNQTKATQINQNGLEFFRKERDRLGWNEFESSITAGTFCLPSTAATVKLPLTAGTCTPTTNDSTFTRSVAITETGGPPATAISFTVTTSWVEGTQQLYSTQSGVLKKWN